MNAARRFARDLDRLARLGAALEQLPEQERGELGGVIEMQEIAPGVFAKREPRRAPLLGGRLLVQLEQLRQSHGRVRAGFAGVKQRLR